MNTPISEADKFQLINAEIEKFARSISEELAERRMYDTKEFTAFAKTRLFMAIKSCVILESTNLEKQRIELLKKLDQAPRSKRRELEAELGLLTAKKKEQNRLVKTMSDYDEYRQLKHFIETKYGYEVLQDFYENHCQKEEHRKNKALLR